VLQVIYKAFKFSGVFSSFKSNNVKPFIPNYGIVPTRSKNQFARFIWDIYYLKKMVFIQLWQIIFSTQVAEIIGSDLKGNRLPGVATFKV